MKKYFQILLYTTGITGLFFLLGLEGYASIKDTSFTIDVGVFSPGGRDLVEGTTDGTISGFLDTVLGKLIMVFGVCSAFIMTIGAGYMIIYHGQDDFLSKGKSIFSAGLIALVIALSAGIIVRLFSYLLYS